jgi:hypothetical protein
MTTLERDVIASPAVGLVIFNTTTNGLEFYKGSAIWVSLVNSSSSNSFVDLTTDQTIAGAKTFSSGVIGNLTGNSTTATTATSSTNVSGIVAIANGGTGFSIQNFVDLTTDQTIVGAKTFTGALTLGAVTYPSSHGTTGQVLETTGNGSLVWSTPSTTASNMSGIVDLANGGTGSATQNFVDLTTAQTIAGAKTFSADIKSNGLTIGLGLGSNPTNTAIGSLALSSNTTGNSNTANGYQSLSANRNGNFNTANGSGSLLANISGLKNTASGHLSLSSNTIGSDNTANGFESLKLNTGSYNTALGSSALNINSTGNNNTASGYQTMASNTSGDNNTANGYQSLGTNSTGANNTAIGYQSMGMNSTGASNTASGNQSLGMNSTGANNTAIGNQALLNNTAGNNTAIGNLALGTNTTGTNNTAIGYGADVSLAALTNATAIGNGAIVKKSNSIQLGNTSVTSIMSSGNIINLNPTLVPINTTATATPGNIVSGYIYSTTAAAVIITMPTATQIANLLFLNGVTQGTSFEFSVENTGTNDVTLVLTGTGISTQGATVVTGSDNLTVSAFNKIGRFRLVYQTGSTALLFRIY